MIASLPMYDWPEVRHATDAFWAAIARRLEVNLPLERGENHKAPWHSPNLLFSQTCGYPFTHAFNGKLTYIATPHYNADGCSGANYCSMIFAREARHLADFKGSRAVINAPDSMSGMLALHLGTASYARRGRFFSSETLSGSHIASLEWVRDGKADICAIDAVCVAMARRYRPELLRGVVEVARSPQVPGLPFVTASKNPEPMRAALADVMRDPALQDTRSALLLDGISELCPTAYDVILELEQAL
jgi:ABC-type phosphate/phosphonate transport system substrate-binding protein